MKNICTSLLCLLLFAGWNSAAAQNYHESDKAALRAFLRQPSATAGEINAQRLGLAVADTLIWTTNEDWVAQVAGLTWNATTPKRVTRIIWSLEGVAGSLNLNGCTELTDLNCGVNQLTALDVSNNTALGYLECYGNQLTALDVSNNWASSEEETS
ncbi:MAG: hypothetical protein LBN37_04345 [Bacteroidales bacterium]|jgi:hypothetical protein|nr:hypothetical protein [Bacteroidales bacterium]